MIICNIGDLYKKENILEFGNTVKQRTDQQGVDLAVADGVRKNKRRAL